MGRDKRQHKRYIFPNDENMTIKVCLAGKSGPVEARLLNVSVGGMGIAAIKGHLDGIEEDSELLIESLTGIPQLQSLREVQLKVRWVLDHLPFDNLGIGCEFVNLHDKGREEIVKLVK